MSNLKLVSPKAELSVLRGMCSKDKKIAGALLAGVDESFFHSEESVEVYKTIQRIMADTGESPSYRLLIEDPDLSKEARNHMRESQASVTTTADAKKAVSNLEKYRKRRGIYNLAVDLANGLKAPKFDADAVLHRTANAISVIRAKKATDDSFLHFGRNNNSMKMVDAVLYEDNSVDVIPTKIDAFDAVSGGVYRGALFTIGANSGGGKCLTGDTEVLLPDGETITLEDIWKTAEGPELAVPGCDIARRKQVELAVQTYEGVFTASRVFKTRGKTIRLEFEDGTVVEGLAEHMLMERVGESGYRWTRLDQIGPESDILSYEEMKQLLSMSR